jgi:hypothetical protein
MIAPKNKLFLITLPLIPSGGSPGEPFYVISLTDPTVPTLREPTPRTLSTTAPASGGSPATAGCRPWLNFFQVLIFIRKSFRTNFYTNFLSKIVAQFLCDNYV